jgi:hypothetical protein
MSIIYLHFSHLPLLTFAYFHLVIDIPVTFSFKSHLSIAAEVELYVLKYKIKQIIYYYLFKVISHRDILIGHLVWVTIFLGLHSFGAYIHNDTFFSLGRLEDTFSDSSIQLKLVFAMFTKNQVQAYIFISIESYVSSYFNLESLITLLGTSDFMVSYIQEYNQKVESPLKNSNLY